MISLFFVRVDSIIILSVYKTCEKGGRTMGSQRQDSSNRGGKKERVKILSFPSLFCSLANGTPLPSLVSFGGPQGKLLHSLRD